jgi:DNA uptake protein ComE-like DNA-binding protein
MPRFSLLATLIAGVVAFGSAAPASADEIGKPIRLFPIIKAAEARTAKASPAAPKLDINSAPEHELDGLPGVGAILAKKIVDGRPYRSTDELVRRKILPQSAYDGIKDRVVAHRQAQAAVQ